MTLRVFIQHLTKALQTKTGQPPTDVTRAVRRIYGIVIAYAKTHPDRLDWLNMQVDYLPRGWDLTRYAATIKDIVQDELNADNESQRRGRPWSRSTPKQQKISSIVDSLISSMMSRRRST